MANSERARFDIQMHHAAEPATYLQVELSSEGAAGCVDWGAYLARVLAASGIPMAILGGWVLWRGIRRAYYLRVQTRDDARKLVLGSKVDLAEVSALLEAARSRFGYAVGWDIEEARPPAVARPTRR